MKEIDTAQDLKGVQIKDSLPVDFEEVTIPVTARQEEDCESSERFADGEAEEATRDVIRGLEALWGKAPLPADFREVLAIPLPTGIDR